MPQLEKKILSLFKDSGELNFPDEDWVFQVLPELDSLEPDTLDALLQQAQTHAKYERAARELLMQERYRLEREHSEEMRGLRATLEAETVRTELGAERKLKELDEQKEEERENLREEAMERIKALEETIDDLEERLEAKTKECEDMEREAQEECSRLREEGEEVTRQLTELQQAADLKVETSRKLKEEIIDNDRLTVANLNRIKLLESHVEQHKAALEESEAENTELRAELQKSVSSEEAEEEIQALRELLVEREKQLLSMSRRLQDVGDGYGGSPAAMRRDSFLDRIGSSMKTHLASSSA